MLPCQDRCIVVNECRPKLEAREPTSGTLSTSFWTSSDNLYHFSYMLSIPPAVPPIIVSALRSKGANGHTTFVPQIRKLIFEYCDKRHSSEPLRKFLLHDIKSFAFQNPHVEIVVKPRPQRQPIVRGLYSTHLRLLCNLFAHNLLLVNGRDKVIGLNGVSDSLLKEKVQLLLDSSGSKIRSLKRRPVESRTESPRGIWSSMHVPEPYKI